MCNAFLEKIDSLIDLKVEFDKAKSSLDTTAKRAKAYKFKGQVIQND